VKLPEPQVAFDPRVTELRHPATTAVLGLGLVRGHLFPEGCDRRIYYSTHQPTAVALIFRTALCFADASLTLIEFHLRNGIIGTWLSAIPTYRERDFTGVIRLLP
jgi:hypothetical protein